MESHFLIIQNQIFFIWLKWLIPWSKPRCQLIWRKKWNAIQQATGSPTAKKNDKNNFHPAVRIDLMHWCHVSITTTPCWGVKTCRAARTCCAGRAHWRSASQSVRGPGPARRYGMQGLAIWLHLLGDGARGQCLVVIWPPTRGGALLWRHMHVVYSKKVY